MNPKQLELISEREYITFFRSYRNIYEKFTPDQKIEFIDAIFSYSFDGVEVEELKLNDPIVNVVFDGVLPNLKNNRVKYLNSKLAKGSENNGRPKKADERLKKGEKKAKKRLKKGNKNINNKEEEKKVKSEDLAKEILDYYLKLKPCKHDTSRGQAKVNIINRLKSYTLDELMGSVLNYEKVLKRNGHYGTKYAYNSGNFFGRDSYFEGFLQSEVDALPPIEDDPRNATLEEWEKNVDPYQDPFATGEL